MNKVYLMGVVATEPKLISGENAPPHSLFSLMVWHQAKTGGKQEYYPINAWNQAAQWAGRQLRTGERVLVEGYLTQRLRPEGYIQIEVTASRFYPQEAMSEPEDAEHPSAEAS